MAAKRGFASLLWPRSIVALPRPGQEPSAGSVENLRFGSFPRINKHMNMPRNPSQDHPSLISDQRSVFKTGEVWQPQAG